MNKFNLGFLLALSLFTQNTLAADLEPSMTLAVANTGSNFSSWTPDMDQKEQVNQNHTKSLDKAIEAMNQKLNLQMEAKISEMMNASLEQ